jgi:glycosyltransferase involved in cell wall biosynthesis
MHVGIDLTALLDQPTGVDNYVASLVTHMARLRSRARFTLFVNAADRGRFDGALPDSFRMVPCSLRARPARLAFQQALLPAAAAALRLDVVHSPAFIMPLVRGRARHLLTVYDMTFFTMPHLHNRLHRSRVFTEAVRLSIRRADRVSVPSESTRRELLAALPDVPPERVEVIPPGIGEAFGEVPAEQVGSVRRRWGLPAHYVLHVGTLEPRKNLPLLLEAYRRLVAAGRAPGELVLAGARAWGWEPIRDSLHDPVLRGRVRVLGYVPPEDLAALYAGATMFVFPSVSEGFGFPPLEAMSCGVPTIAARTSALAENLEGAAELVAPGDAVALAAAIDRLARQQQLRRRRREQGLERARQFRWEQAARLTLAAYEQLAGSPGRP